MSQASIRAALQTNADGLTATQIAKLVNKHRNSVVVAIKAMPDVYIDYWTVALRGAQDYVPVYVAVQVPENAPRPD